MRQRPTERIKSTHLLVWFASGLKRIIRSALYLQSQSKKIKKRERARWHLLPKLKQFVKEASAGMKVVWLADWWGELLEPLDQLSRDQPPDIHD